jgi:hypothetical protein
MAAESFFLRCSDGKHNHPLEVQAAIAELPRIVLGAPPSAERLARYGAERREHDGTSVQLAEDGRAAYTDTVAGLRHPLNVCEQIGRTTWRPGERRRLVISSDAGQVATASKGSRCATALIVRERRALRGAQLLAHGYEHARHRRPQRRPRRPALALPPACRVHQPRRARGEGGGVLPCCSTRLRRPDAVGPCFACADEPMEVDVLLTGDSKNLVSMSGTASHDLSPQLSNLWIYRLDVSSPWQLRTYEEAMLDAHAVGGGTCPGCADIPESEERVEREHARRQQMASDAAKTTAMLAHRGYWLAPILAVDFDHSTTCRAWMRFMHNVTTSQRHGHVLRRDLERRRHAERRAVGRQVRPPQHALRHGRYHVSAQPKVARRPVVLAPGARAPRRRHLDPAHGHRHARHPAARLPGRGAARRCAGCFRAARARRARG